MKDLKENIQKNNMKILAISAVLGMFYYCSNNASKKTIDINDVLTLIVESQIKINDAKKAIEPYAKKIYIAIKDKGKVKKGKVIDFIECYCPLPKEGIYGEYLNDIIILKQYFHLEEEKETDYECTKDNLTEIFWEEVKEPEEEDTKEIERDGGNKITAYFKTIIDAEKAISKAFKTYYDAKKKVKKEAQHVKILKEIMNDCCGEGTGDDIQTKFLDNLGKLCTAKSIDNSGSKITGKIKRRITLSNGTEEYETDFISFLKQKIGEEKKENNPGGGKGGKPAEEEGCSCCNDCCGKKG